MYNEQDQAIDNQVLIDNQRSMQGYDTGHARSELLSVSDFDKKLKSLLKILSGEKLDKTKGTYVTDENNRMINMKGVNSTINFLHFVATHAITQGNFKEEKINKLWEQLADDYAQDLFNNYKEYGINARKYNLICDMVGSFVYGVLTHAITTKPTSDKELLKGTVDERTINIRRPDGSKGSMLGLGNRGMMN